MAATAIKKKQATKRKKGKQSTDEDVPSSDEGQSKRAKEKTVSKKQKKVRRASPSASVDSLADEIEKEGEAAQSSTAESTVEAKEDATEEPVARTQRMRRAISDSDDE